MEECITRFPEYADFKRMEDGNTALHIAASNDKLEILKYLSSLPHIDLNVRNNQTHTPLHCAIIGGYSTIIEALVGYGADINAADLEGNTALHILLIKKVAKPLSEELTPHMVKVQKDMKKILGVSSVAHYMAVACFLVQQGADTHARNRRGQTVMDMIPKEMAPALMNFINDVDRGMFHGSLRGPNGAAGANAPEPANRPAPVQQATSPSQVVSHTAQSSSGSQQAVADAPKRNTGNQRTPQQQTTPPPIKDSKVSPTSSQSSTSDQLQHRLLQLEESLKEKAGFLPLQLSDHSDTSILQGQSSDSLHLEDSNVSAPSEESSGSGSAYHVTKESELQESPSGLNQQQTATEEVDAVMCFLCDEESSNVKFLPCGHTVMCSKCAVRTKRCPQCQVGIKEKLKL